MAGFRRLREEDGREEEGAAFADVEMVVGGGERRIREGVHGLVLGACSELLRSWMTEAKPSPSQGAHVSALCRSAFSPFLPNQCR